MSDLKNKIRICSENLFDSWPLRSFLQRNRWRICPFEVVFHNFGKPVDTMLDVGCGAGLFISLARNLGFTKSGIGIDISGPAIADANELVLKKKLKSGVKFCQVASFDDWPSGKFQLASSIDVVHHIPVKFREKFYDRLSLCIGAKGRVIVKDMAPHPRIFAFFNFLHDLVMSRQFIQHEAPSKVVAALESRGLKLKYSSTNRRYMYMHYTLIFERS